MLQYSSEDDIRTVDDEIALLTELRDELERLGDTTGAQDCYRLIMSLSGARGRFEVEQGFRLPQFSPRESLSGLWEELARPTRGKLEAAATIASRFDFNVGYEAYGMAALIRSAVEEEFAVRTAQLRRNQTATKAKFVEYIGLASRYLKDQGQGVEATRVDIAHKVRIAGNLALHPYGVFDSEQMEILLNSTFAANPESTDIAFWNVLVREFPGK